MAQILGVDYGSTRVGLAVSSPEGSYALPLQTLTVPERARAAAVAECARMRDIRTIVVGRPIRSAGEDSALWPAIEKFAVSLRRRGFEVEFENEAYSTAEAESLLREAGTQSSRNRGSADALAAKLIVESYLRRTDVAE
jgi:putative Holliday junction resolvase